MSFSKYALLAAPLTFLPAIAAHGAEPSSNQPPAKAQKVGPCDRYGRDYIYVPGVDTCFHIGGVVGIETQYLPGHDIYNVATGQVSQRASAQATMGMGVLARINLETRKETSWGSLESMISVRGIVGDGVRSFKAPSSEFMTSYAAAGYSSSATVVTERAYVKLAGLTAGLDYDRFSTIPPYMFGPTIGGNFVAGVKQVAYRYDFGAGFSSTVALESKGDMAGNTVIAGDGATLGPSVVPYATSVQYTNQWDNSTVLVGNLRNDAKWGFIQGNVAVAKNTINATTLTSAYNPLNTPTGYPAWAAGFSARYLMPFIAPGDEFRFQSAFTQGIIGLVASTGSTNDYTDFFMSRGVGGIITVPQNMIPTAVTATGAVTSVGQSSAYNVVGMYTHYWSPEWRSNADVGYMQIFMPKAYSTGVGADLNTQAGNASLLITGVNLIWSPNQMWSTGIELDYLHLTQSIQNPDAAFVAAGMPGLKGDGVAVSFRLDRHL
jgi:Porin subfamily